MLRRRFLGVLAALPFARLFRLRTPSLADLRSEAAIDVTGSAARLFGESINCRCGSYYVGARDA